MSEDEIRQMEAGRALDALVAEKIFHIEVELRPLTNHGGYLVPEDWYPAGALCHPAKAIPHYSTDIAAAWEVVDKWAEIEKSPVSVNWGTMSGEDPHASAVSFFGSGLVVVAPTAPLAICRAALLAVMEAGE